MAILHNEVPENSVIYCMVCKANIEIFHSLWLHKITVCLAHHAVNHMIFKHLVVQNCFIYKLVLLNQKCVRLYENQLHVNTSGIICYNNEQSTYLYYLIPNILISNNNTITKLLMITNNKFGII